MHYAHIWDALSHMQREGSGFSELVLMLEDSLPL